MNESALTLAWLIFFSIEVQFLTGSSWWSCGPANIFPFLFLLLNTLFWNKLGFKENWHITGNRISIVIQYLCFVVNNYWHAHNHKNHELFRYRQKLEGFLLHAMEAGLISDGALAQDINQASSFWRIREVLFFLFPFPLQSKPCPWFLILIFMIIQCGALNSWIKKRN